MGLLPSASGEPDKPIDNRYYVRFPAYSRVILFWRDRRGQRRSARARVLDMSGSGALVRTGACIDPGSFVYVKSKELGLMGSARVCYSLPGVFTYKMGLQFPAPLIQHF